MGEAWNYTNRMNNRVKIFHLDSFSSCVTRMSDSSLLSHDLKHRHRISVIHLKVKIEWTCEKTNLGIWGGQQRRCFRIAILIHSLSQRLVFVNFGRGNLKVKGYGFGGVRVWDGSVWEGRGKEKEENLNWWIWDRAFCPNKDSHAAEPNNHYAHAFQIFKIQEHLLFLFFFFNNIVVICKY